MEFLQVIANSYKSAYPSDYTWVMFINSADFYFERDILEAAGDFHEYCLPSGWLIIIIRSMGTNAEVQE